MDTTVRHAFDVVIAGGGPAGVAAALAAARRGARTLLVEAGAVLGGNATCALVHTICGLYLPADVAAPRHAHAGLPRRLAEGLAAAGGAGVPERAGRVFVLPIHPPALEAFLARLVAATPGLTCWTDAPVAAAALAGDAAARSTLVVARPEGRATVDAAVVVDATGDATVGALGGATLATAAPAELQHASYVFQLAGIDGDVGDGFARLRVTVATAAAVRAGTLPPEAESVLLRPGAAPGEAYATLTLPKPADRPWDPLDPAQRAALETAGRALAERIVAHLRATRRAFRAARVAAWPRRLGVRETRRLVGHVVVEAADVLAGRRREDEVALSTWPIELWHDHRRAELRHPTGPSSVPLGALVSASHPSLGMAGRCLSATHEALGALRVIGTALATGEAVGTAAALAADGGTTLAAVDPVAVRAALRTEQEAAA